MQYMTLEKIYGLFLYFHLINFYLTIVKKIMTLNKNTEIRLAVGWISVRRAERSVSRGAGPQLPSGGFPSSHSN